MASGVDAGRFKREAHGMHKSPESFAYPDPYVLTERLAFVRPQSTPLAM